MARLDPNSSFRGKTLIFTRIVWVVAFVWTASLFGAGLKLSYFDYLNGNVPDIAMARLTLPTIDFLTTPLFRIIEFVAAIVFFTAGTLLFWLLGREKMAWLTSLSMITGVPSTAAPILSLGNNLPQWYPLMAGLQAFGFTLFVAYFYVFPDGHFKPNWTRIAGLLMLLFALSFPFCRQCNPFSTQSTIPIALLSAFLLLGLAVQTYRYRYLSSPIQRQQSKWVVFGLVTVVTGSAGITISRIMFPALLSQPFDPLYDFVLIPVAFLLQLAVPVAFLLAITRSRLWDVDILIRKTLQYTFITGLLGVVYFISIVLLQNLFTAVTGQESAVSIALSTLLIAALFSSVRRRVQDIIDRHFYRRKYDAQQVLARFAVTARDETDLEKLVAELEQVVEGTMQPEKAGVWLCHS